jgi:hypothetical protein
MFFPWRGQFALYAKADVAIILDTVQWVKNHWYNRNLISGMHGPQWITVPVHVTHLHQKIKDVEINAVDSRWRKQILNGLQASYGRAPYFKTYFPEVDRLLTMPWARIAPLAQASIEVGFRALGRPVALVRASDLDVEDDDPIGRLVALCRAVGASRYISGPAAKAYIGEGAAFEAAGIRLEWMTYDYPEYPQLRKYRERALSILDLLFNCGPNAPRYIWPERHETRAAARLIAPASQRDIAMTDGASEGPWRGSRA